MMPHGKDSRASPWTRQRDKSLWNPYQNPQRLQERAHEAGIGSPFRSIFATRTASIALPV